MAPNGEKPERSSDFPALKGVEIDSLYRAGRRSQWLSGRQVMLERRVAVKRLKAELAADPEIKDGFIKASRMAGGIVHHGALGIFNIYPDDGATVMEWCSDPPLAELGGKVPVMDAIALGIAVLDCLAALHATARAHGNLTPGNVFITNECGVKIGDFFQPPVLDNPAFSASVAFTAPETLAGGLPDWRSDSYSLGKLLLHVLSPIDAKDQAEEVFRAFCAEDPEQRPESSILAQERLFRLKQAEARKRGLVSHSTMRRRRQYRRIPTEISVSVRKRSATPVETAAILSRIRDIGENGVFVATDEPMPVGSIVELDFALLREGSGVHAFGLVRWIVDSPFAQGMGVQFVEVDEASRNALREYVESRPDQE